MRSGASSDPEVQLYFASCTTLIGQNRGSAQAPQALDPRRLPETKMALLVGLSAASLLMMLVVFRLYVVLKAGRNCPFRAKESFAVVVVAGSGSAAK